MSLILDALKKADAQRHLGDLPGLHSRPSTAAARSAGSEPWRRLQVMPIVLCVLALAVIALSWKYTGGRSEQPPGVPAQSTSAPGQSTAVPARSTLPPTKSTAMPAVVLPGIAQPAAPTMPAAPVATSPEAVLPSEVTASRLPVPPPAPKSPVPARKDAPSGQGPAGDDAPAAMRLRTTTELQPELDNLIALTDLPPHIQRELPGLSISGTIYSATPSARLLLVDKRMLREGDEIAPGLVLVTVLPKGARLRYKGYLFKISG